MINKFFDFFWNTFDSKTMKISKIIYYSHAKQPTEFKYQSTHQNLLYMPHPLLFVNDLVKKHHKILVHFDNVFVFQNLLKDEEV